MQQKWNEAGVLDAQVVEIHRRVLGREHPQTLASITNQALTYMNQGLETTARCLFEEVMNKNIRMLGEEHRDTLSSMTNLAFYDSGREADSEELLVRVIEIAKKVLGKEHPDTLSSIDHLSSMYWRHGQWAKAVVDVHILSRL